MEFFGISSEGNFDIVHAVIVALGETWDFFKLKIEAVVLVLTTLWNTISYVASVLWSIFGPIIMDIVGLVGNLITAFNNFRTGQLDLPGFIMTVLTALWNTYTSILGRISGLIVQWGSQILARGVSAARNFINGIIARIRQLPGKMYSALIAVVSYIVSAIGQWASTAASKVQSVISSITSPFSGVASAISGALSGVVSAIVAPFQNAWNQLKPLVDKIKGAMDILPSFGGEPAYGGETVSSTGFNIYNGQYTSEASNEPIIIEDNINLTLDLKNVPSNISTDGLIEALTDKTVLNALVNNRDFQSIDANVKQKLDLKVRRSGH